MNTAIDIATKLIKLNEGCKLEVYTCPAGYKTFGYGTNLEVLSGAYNIPSLDKHGDIYNYVASVEFAFKCKQIGIDKAIAQIDDNKQKQALANIFLDYEIINCKKALNAQKWFTAYLSDFQQAIIIDLAYNVGVAGVLKFKNMIKAIIDHNYGLAGAEMLDSKYHYQMICFGCKDELADAEIDIAHRAEVVLWHNDLDEDCKQLRSASNALSLQFDKPLGKYKELF